MRSCRIPFCRKPSYAAMTAVEVVASTILASMLMVAVIGVLRGLKAKEDALAAQAVRRPWARSLDAVLHRDLQNSYSYQSTISGIILTGYGGRTEESGVATWLPTTIVYAVNRSDNQSWLVRREVPQFLDSQPNQELVLSGVSALRVLSGAVGNQNTAATTTARETPIPSSLTFECLSPSGELIYAYQFVEP